MLDNLTLGDCVRTCWHKFLVILDVLLHRGWISTLGVIVVAFLLIRNDQSRDVLSGLGEAVLFFNQLDSASAWYSAGAYVAFWVSAMLLAAVLALIAYVTGGSNPSIVAPRETTEHAVWHSAQIIVLATLWIVYLALLWQMRAASFGMIALPAIVLAFVFVPWTMLRWLCDGTSARLRLMISALISILFIALLFCGISTAGIATTAGGSLAVAAIAATPSLVILAMAAVRSRLPAEYQARINVLLVSLGLLSFAVLAPWEPSAIWTIGSALRPRPPRCERRSLRKDFPGPIAPRPISSAAARTSAVNKAATTAGGSLAVAAIAATPSLVILAIAAVRASR